MVGAPVFARPRLVFSDTNEITVVKDFETEKVIYRVGCKLDFTECLHCKDL